MLIKAGEWQGLDSIEKSNLLIYEYQKTYGERIARAELDYLRKIKNKSAIHARKPTYKKKILTK